jgi:8-amino-7-oxononanoate synthase
LSESLLAPLEQKLRALEDQGLRRVRQTTHTPCRPRVIVEGEQLLAFNSNDYLGLAAHEQIIAALQEGASLYGVGSGSSHLISGHSKAHRLLEERLANLLSLHVPSARALYFGTGYMANLSILSSLADSAGSDLCIFSESLNHASLIDGMRLARSPLQRYAHCDTEALAELLTRSTARTKLVVTDSVFSMDGDIAPIAELLALCERHGAWLLVDDAHGFGTLGPKGIGVLEHLRLRSSQLIYMGTLGKAAGVGGAFVAAHETLIDWMVQRARPYIYATATPPAMAHALLTSLEIITGAEGARRRAHLEELIQQVKAIPLPAGWTRPASQTAIHPWILGTNAATLAASARLRARGIWVSAIRAPTVPTGSARLRISLSAAHTHDDLTQLAHALQ